jgi:hypothetical protein
VIGATELAIARPEIALYRPPIAIGATELAIARPEIALYRPPMAIGATEIAIARPEIAIARLEALHSTKLGGPTYRYERTKGFGAERRDGGAP